MGNYVVVNDGNFDAEVLKANIPVIVDFWAEWCAPCKLIEPLVEQIGEEFAGQVKIAKLDVDSNPQTSMQYNIRSIPTLLIFRNGSAVEQIIGAVPKNVILDKLMPHLG